PDDGAGTLYVTTLGDGIFDLELPIPAGAPHVIVTSSNTAASTLQVGGGATGSNLSFVFWSTNRGHAGFASGTNSFTATVPLETGSNLVTITAVDGAGNQGKIFPPIDASPQGSPPPLPQSLPALGPAKAWLGLASTSDLGIKFDLRSEVLVNGTVVGSGQINSVPGGFTNSTGAKLNSIPQSLANGPVALSSGDVVSIRVLARNACS